MNLIATKAPKVKSHLTMFYKSLLLLNLTSSEWRHSPPRPAEVRDLKIQKLKRSWTCSTPSSSQCHLVPSPSSSSTCPTATHFWSRTLFFQTLWQSLTTYDFIISITYYENSSNKVWWSEVIQTGDSLQANFEVSVQKTVFPKKLIEELDFLRSLSLEPKKIWYLIFTDDVRVRQILSKD